jgi:uncharacterized lipoprotein YmbA
MKKILAIMSIVALASCGNGASSNEVKADSTAVVADSTKVDSTVAPVVDSVKVAEESK